jgi:hypothetical protein
MPGEDFHLPSQTRFQAHYPPQSGWLGEWDRLKGGRPNGLSVALKRALVHESRSGRWYHPRFPARGCTGELAPVQNPPWTRRNHEPRNALP